MSRQTCYIALGANLGNAPETVKKALAALAGIEQSTLVRCSSLYRSAPFEAEGPDFINAVAELHTALEPFALLAALQALEAQAGRERPYRNAPRTLDLDIVLYGDLELHSPTLTLPHPRWRERAFVLLPLHEVAPHWVSQDTLIAVKSQAIEKLTPSAAHHHTHTP